MGGHNGIKSDLLANSGNAQNLSNQYSSNALGLDASLAPALATEAAHPPGYDPTTLASMRTNAEQAAGGGAAAGVGEAQLRAGRTRNIGSGQAAGAAANRTASQDLSQVNTGIDTKNADLKAKQMQAGLTGEGALAGEETGAGENALGLSTGALNGAGNLKDYWQQLLSQGIGGGTSVASAGYGNGGAFG